MLVLVAGRRKKSITRLGKNALTIDNNQEKIYRATSSSFLGSSVQMKDGTYEKMVDATSDVVLVNNTKIF